MTAYYKYKKRQSLWAVYTISVPICPTPIWIGHAPISRIYDAPDTRGNALIQQYISEEQDEFSITLLCTFPNKEEAQQALQLILLGMPPLSIQHEGMNDPPRPRGRPSKGEIIELTTQEYYDSATHAAEVLNLNKQAISRNLRKVDGYKKIKGKYRFRYVDDIE